MNMPRAHSACFDASSYKYDVSKLSVQQQAALYGQLLTMWMPVPWGTNPMMMPATPWDVPPHAMPACQAPAMCPPLPIPTPGRAQPMQLQPLQAPLPAPEDSGPVPICARDPAACDDDILALFEDIQGAEAAQQMELSSIASDSSNDTAVVNNGMYMGSDVLTPHLSVGHSDATVGNATPDAVDIMGPDMDLDIYLDQQLMGLGPSLDVTRAIGSETAAKASPFDNSAASAALATTPTHPHAPTSPSMHSQAGSSTPMAPRHTAVSLPQRSASLPTPRVKGGVRKPQADAAARRKPMPGPVLLGASGCDLIAPPALHLMRAQHAGVSSRTGMLSPHELLDDSVNDGLMATMPASMFHNLWMDDEGPSSSLL